MPQVVVSINTRSYAVACGDGEEQHLLRLAAEVDRRVSDLARDVGQVGDARLLLMASLLLADDLEDAQERAAAAEEALALANENSAGASDKAQEIEAKSAGFVERLAQRVETIAARLAPA